MSIASALFRAGSLLAACAGVVLSVSCSRDVVLAPSNTSASGNRQAQVPIPAFVVTSTALISKPPLTFDASGTVDQGVRCGSACSFAWTFGDNATGSGETVTHAYDASGSYVVTLTVTHTSGAAATLSHSVAVQALSPPIADFTYSPTTPTAFQDITFTAAKSTASAGRQIVSYAWD